MALAASPLAERKRVKVYELRKEDWFDRGTGFCAIQTIVAHGDIIVFSEESPQTELLKITIKKDDNYQKQQDTLIVWTDPTSMQDMALSFQESEGCGIVWDAINEAQTSIEGYVKPIPNLELPPPSLSELNTIELILRNGGSTQAARDSVFRHLNTDIYIPQLMSLVEQAEDLESIEDLHQLCNIVKQLVLYNEATIIERLIKDDIFQWTMGALEYDPDFPHHKANHRDFLNNSSDFKEIVPITKPVIREKIHCTYRLQYLKDVALARVLDDPSFSLFNSMIYFNQIEIITFVASDGVFLEQLFSLIRNGDTPPQKKKDAIAFIQQTCAITKPLQVVNRTLLYTNMINAGLFQAINFALQHKDSVVRVAGTDILVAIIDHDMMMMRNTIHKSANENMSPMTDALIDLLLVETDLGVRAQVADAIKVLLDSNVIFSDARVKGTQAVAEFRMVCANKTFLDYHLQPSMKKLFKPLLDLDKRESLAAISFHEASLFSHLIEILSFFIRQPAGMSKQFILTEGLIPRTALLLKCPDKHVRLTAIKFFRTCVAATDTGEHYIRAMIQSHVFETILDMIIEQLPKDNLLMSACLEIFEFCRQHKIRPVIYHLVEDLRETLESIEYVSLFNATSGILAQYDYIMDVTQDEKQNQQQSGDIDSSFLTSEDGSPTTRHEIIQGGGTRWQGLRDTMDEDAYFNSVDDDDDELSRDLLIPNTPSPLSKPLVDYGDDDDEEQIITETPPSVTYGQGIYEDSLSSSISPRVDSPSDKENLDSSSTPPMSTSPPRPPSLAEKRRREEEDDDELVKLSSNSSKRRNSGASFISSHSSIDTSLGKAEEDVAEVTPNVSSEDAVGSPEADKNDSPSGGSQKLPALRRKRGFGPGITSTGPRKIAISLSAAAKDHAEGKQT